MKKNLIATLCLAGMVLGGSQTALAYNRISETEVESEVKSKIILDEVPEPPGPGPVDPEIPPVVLPPDVLYGIDYVSNLDFGSIDFSEVDETLHAQFDSELLGPEVEDPDNPGDFLPNQIFSYLSVRDYRSDDDREPWTVTVSRTNFINGALLTFYPDFSSDASLGAVDIADFTIPASVEVNESPTEFVSKDVNSIGQSGILLGDATLEIPAYSAAGDYSTTLTWNLEAVPTP